MLWSLTVIIIVVYLMLFTVSFIVVNYFIVYCCRGII